MPATPPLSPLAVCLIVFVLLFSPAVGNVFPTMPPSLEGQPAHVAL
jgi:hypothetical protein